MTYHGKKGIVIIEIKSREKKIEYFLLERFLFNKQIV